VIQDLKTILIVTSATLAALFVHHALYEAQATAAVLGEPAHTTFVYENPPVFE
jgi:hypothetical protein